MSLYQNYLRQFKEWQQLEQQRFQKWQQLEQQKFHRHQLQYKSQQKQDLLLQDVLLNQRQLFQIYHLLTQLRFWKLQSKRLHSFVQYFEPLICTNWQLSNQQLSLEELHLLVQQKFQNFLRKNSRVLQEWLLPREQQWKIFLQRFEQWYNNYLHLRNDSILLRMIIPIPMRYWLMNKLERYVHISNRVFLEWYLLQLRSEWLLSRELSQEQLKTTGKMIIAVVFFPILFKRLNSLIFSYLLI